MWLQNGTWCRLNACCTRFCAEFSGGQLKAVNNYRIQDRFTPGEDTTRVIEAKLEGLRVVELLLIKEYNRRVRVRELFVSRNSIFDHRVCVV